MRRDACDKKPQTGIENRVPQKQDVVVQQRIAGAKNREQIEHNVIASELKPLTSGELERALPIADTITTPGWT